MGSGEDSLKRTPEGGGVGATQRNRDGAQTAVTGAPQMPKTPEEIDQEPLSEAMQGLRHAPLGAEARP